MSSTHSFSSIGLSLPIVDATWPQYSLNALATAEFSFMMESPTLRRMFSFTDLIFSVINGLMVSQNIFELAAAFTELHLSLKYVHREDALIFVAAFLPFL